MKITTIHSKLPKMNKDKIVGVIYTALIIFALIRLMTIMDSIPITDLILMTRVLLGSVIVGFAYSSYYAIKEL